MSQLLELSGITKQYEGTEESVLAEVDLCVAAGDMVGIVGPSGSGKSTLLNIIGTLDQPSAGAVRLDGRDALALNDKQLATLRNERIGFVFQLHHLLPQCTIMENVLIPALVQGDVGAAAERGRELLDRVGLAHRLEHRPGQLSGGERQRVAVVRALINQPALLLADEPTGSLDRAASDAIGELLVELNKEQGVAIITVTHSSRLAERMGRVFELRDGTLKKAT
jgi:lipoprotein-releasing system ATP-binding protein